MPFSLRPFALLLPLASILAATPLSANTLRITSTPPGATVQINGVLVGTTPLQIKYPGSYFHPPRLAFSKRLQHQIVARLTLAGYATKEIVLSEGPMEWSSLNGRNHYEYWQLKSDHFDVTFDLIAETFTGGVSAHLPAGNADLAPELSLEALAAIAKPAVVQLQGLQKMGSGFFVTGTGIIATNAHVARDEGTLLATLSNERQIEAATVYIDDELDIALLKVRGENFPHLALAAAETVHQGETVLAIGNPGGAMQFSMTKGIVSAVGKFKEAGPGTWVQTDAPINPGNSGGPLLNTRGEVVGLNTLKLIKKNTNGIGFALSATDLLEVLHRFYPATFSAGDLKAEKLAAHSDDPVDPLKAGVAHVPTATVIFRSPDGGEIYVDDHFVGNIPSTIQLPEGTHRLRVIHQKSADFTKLLELRGGSSITIDAVMPTP